MSSGSKRRGVVALVTSVLLAAVLAPRVWRWFAAPPAPHVIELPPMDRASAAPTHLPGELWVCADTNNMPFSSARADGFENRIAAIVAEGLGRTVRYAWQLPLESAKQAALASGECDLITGVPAIASEEDLTAPYYRSAYVFVTRRDRPPVRSFDDPRLRCMTIGIQLIGDAEAPPARALARRHLAGRVRGFVGNSGISTAPRQRDVIDAVAQGHLDTAAVWGPLAGYYAAQQPVRLAVMPVTPDMDRHDVRFAYDIAMAVRHGETALRDAINRVLIERRAEILGVLRAYHVPVVPPASDARGTPTGATGTP
jgi:mxaJ protein